MEEILSSIKRIIAEDGDDRPEAAPRPERRLRAMRERDSALKATPVEAVGASREDEAEEEVLELTDSMPSADVDTDDFDEVDEAHDYVAAVTAAKPASPAFQPVAAQAETAFAVTSPLLQRKSPSSAAALAPAAPVAAVPVAAPAKADVDADMISQPNIVSQASEAAARSSLATLSSLLVRPTDEAADNTLEGLVREMLRPVLKEWLDANLPTLVEGMVAREIARITGRAL